MEQDGEKIRLFRRETICSAGEEQGSSRELSYTAGALQGAMEQILGKQRLRGKQIESVLRGGPHYVMEFEPI